MRRNEKKKQKLKNLLTRQLFYIQRHNTYYAVISARGVRLIFIDNNIVFDIKY